MGESRRLIRTTTPGIYKRGSGYIVRFRDPAGKPRKRCARTLAEARRIRAEVTADISRGEYRATSRMTLREYYETSWSRTFTGRTSMGIRPDTLARYKADLEKIVIPALGRHRMSEIEPRHLKVFIASQYERDLSDGRVRGIYAPLRALMRTAAEEGVIRFDPTRGVRVAAVRPEVEEPEDHESQAFAYTDEQLAAFLQALPTAWQTFGLFLAQTGVRISEAMALRWTDIDLGAKRVKITRRLYKGTFAPPKSRFGRRSIPLPDDLAVSLWAHRKKADDPAESAPVFPSRTGGYLDYANVYNRILRPTQSRIGARTGAHVLRHTYATNLFRAGWNPKQVQMVLGHHSASFTTDVYVHLLPDDLPKPTSLARLPTATEHSIPPRTTDLAETRNGDLEVPGTNHDLLSDIEHEVEATS